MTNNELFEVVSIFDTIESTSSKTSKEAVLKQHKDNELLREMLDFLYNPFIVTGIGFKKLVKFATFKSDDVIQFEDIQEAMEYLKKNNTGKEENVKAIANFINQHENRVHDFLQEFFTGDVKIGATASTINKVYGKGTIPKFEVMLAEKFEDRVDSINEEFFVTKKVDGTRCVAIKESGVVIFMTRKGHPILDMNDLTDEFKLLPDNTVYDGELLKVNENNISSDKLFRETQKIVRKDGLKKDLEFHIFDMLPLKEFNDGLSSKKYCERREDLEELNISTVKDLKLIHILDVLYKGNDVEKVFELLDEAEQNGEEGVMVNTSNGFYVGKRVSSLLKAKKFYSCDGVVVDIYEGEGKYKGMLGGVRITFKDIIVNIGSGFSDYERQVYWRNKDVIIGKVGEYSYFEESQNKDGEKDLRFATWKCLRSDKDVLDINYE